MLPITIKPLTTESIFHDQWEFWYRKRQKAIQKAPFNLPLPFFLEEGIADPGGPINGMIGSPVDSPQDIIAQCKSPTANGLVTQAANISYERFREAVSENASLGVNFVEYRQALGMIESRAVSMLTAYRKVKKLDFVGATRALAGLTPPIRRPGFIPPNRGWYPKGVSTAKFAGNNWLEYHFGWEPLIKDVYASMEILHNPVKKFASIHGEGKSYSSQGTFSDGGSVSSKISRTWYATHKQGAWIKAVQDPQLHTLEQLGLINPAVLLWEIVPFSFVVDWFASVGDVLRSYSDFAGMTLSEPWSCSIVRCVSSGVTSLKPGFSAMGQSHPRASTANGLRVVRSSGLTKPVFSVKQFRLPSVNRAATAISLLVQGLKG
jgi:hypothetical protein